MFFTKKKKIVTNDTRSQSSSYTSNISSKLQASSNEQTNILLMGTRDKTDFVLYLSHVLQDLSLKVLIIDGTERQLYKQGYTTLRADQHLYDFQGVDILTGVFSWPQAEFFLENESEDISSYDVVLVDVDTEERSLADWNGINLHMYVGDYERLHMYQDAAIIKSYYAKHGKCEFHRVMYYVKHKLADDYFDSLIDYRVKWISETKEIEFDEVDLELRLLMQHTLQIPYKKLSKGYKDALASVVSGVFGYHRSEVFSVFKHSSFYVPKKILAADQL